VGLPGGWTHGLYLVLGRTPRHDNVGGRSGRTEKFIPAQVGDASGGKQSLVLGHIQRVRRQSIHWVSSDGGGGESEKGLEKAGILGKVGLHVVHFGLQGFRVESYVVAKGRMG